MATLTGPTPPRQEGRADQATALLIDAALAIADAQGARVAAACLHQQGVAFTTTVRALKEPDLRRPPPR